MPVVWAGRGAGVAWAPCGLLFGGWRSVDRRTSRLVVARLRPDQRAAADASADRSLLPKPKQRAWYRAAQIARQVAFPVGGFTASWCSFPIIVQRIYDVVNTASVYPSNLSQVLSGSFLPLISLILATLVSVTVSTLRQRQEDIRYLLYEELSLIRTITSLVQDEEVLREMRRYVLSLNTETFGRSNLSKPDLIATQMRADDTFDRVISKAAFLRESISGSLLQMTALRSRRRAVLETGFPTVHYGIIIFLGLCGMATYAAECSSQRVIGTSLPIRFCFSVLGGVGSWVTILTADLADPFNGIYSMDQERIFRSVGRLDKKLESLQ